MARKRTGAIKESREHLLKLEEEFSGKPVEKRITMLLLLQHDSQREFGDIAMLIGSTAPTIKRWWQIYREGGIDALIYPREHKRPLKDQALTLLKEKLGNAEFHSLEEVQEWIDAQKAERSEPPDETPEEPSSRRWKRGPANTENNPETHLDRSIITFLSSLPQEMGALHWVEKLRDGLSGFLGDVDRISIAANLACDLLEPQNYTPRILVTQGPTYKNEQVKEVIASADHLQQSIEEMKRSKEFDHDQYHSPIGFSYYLSGAYLGMIILWRKRSGPPISERTRQIMHDLHDFFQFLLMDVVARDRYARPTSDLFIQAWAIFTKRFDISPQEGRILMHILFGYSYKDIARLMNLSENTVRYHIKSIYAKAEVHSQAELFARYFTVQINVK